MKILILALILSACGDKKRPIETISDTEALRQKYDTYLELAKSEVDQFGWLSPKCDGLLFNSLASIAGFPVNPLDAEESPGRFRRHPDFSYCKPGGLGSGSTVSRDQFRGVIPWALVNKRKDVLQRIHDYGMANGWIMGEGEFSRTYFNPSIRNQLKRALDMSEDPETTELSDYEAHLDVLRIWTESLISGWLFEFEVEALHNYAVRYPDNALFVAMYHKFTDGDMRQAIAILLEREDWFPAHRLPKDTDRFTHYLFQRDPGPDWEPCNDSGEQRRCEGLVHNGIDLMFVAWIILN